LITIQDNGPGIKTSTIKAILDYGVRVSSREAYVSPTRGAQGNALKTILAMGYVIDRWRGSAAPAGVTIIETRGTKHTIEFRVDHINNEPKITHVTEPSPVEVGTGITVAWTPEWKWWEEMFRARVKFLELAQAYAWFNPHLSMRLTWFGEVLVDVTATDPDWEKWRPRNPTSAHWYDEARLQRYLAAHVSRDRDLRHHRTVREFVSEFRGLSGTAVQRKVLEEVGCSHQSLAQFFGIDEVNTQGIAKLLAAMQRHSRPVAPKHLGVIGKAHFERLFLMAGGNADTFKYEKRAGATADIPYVIEFAFGLHQSGLEAAAKVERRFIVGANWSAAIGNPFRTFGQTGEGLENTLAQVRANADQPVICCLHLACPHIQYADRGKSSIILTDDAEQPDD
jgi:DNA topoisomerase VI subunit B